MTIVNIDLKNVGKGTNPVDKVIFYSPVYRDGTNSSELVSTAEEHVYLVDGVGAINLTPGPVRVRFSVRGIADTMAKDGVVPNSGTVSLNEVIQGSLTYAPPVVSDALDLINNARDEALAAVNSSVDVAIADQLDGKADKSVVDALVLRVPAGGWSGQLLKITSSGGVWSWADRYPPTYHNAY